MSKVAIEKLGYRACVGVMLLNRMGLVWVGHRPDQPDEEGSGQWWQMPQGGIDGGEISTRRRASSARRPTSAPSSSSPRRRSGLLRPAAASHRHRWKGRYRGQKQKWFAFRFVGDESEVDLAALGHKPEFDSWRWAAMDELEALIVPFKRKVYEQVVAAFRHLGVT